MRQLSNLSTLELPLSVEGELLHSLSFLLYLSISPLGMVRSFIHLPDEILNSILCYSSPRSCAALEQTHTRFRNVTKEPLLWRHHCQSHYKYWDRRHELRQKLTRPVQEIDWKGLFVYRYLVDRSITGLLDGILDSQTGRFGKFRSVVDLGEDAKDTLLRHSRVESGEDLLARRWACLCSIGMYDPQVDQSFMEKDIMPALS